MPAADPTLADVLAELRAQSAELRAVRALVGQRPRRLVPAAEAAAYVGYSRREFDRLVAEGELPAGVRIGTGSNPRWDVRRLDAAIEARHAGRRPRKAKKKTAA